MARKNAQEYLEKSIDKIKHRDDMTVNACNRLQTLLNLKKYPRRMECYDISNVSGVDKVGSMVVFIDGEADRSSYRRFKIRTVEGANDFASLQEVSVKISHRDYSLKMLQRIRDEAHRFAITYFRNLHSKNSLSSVLSEIDGIGKAKRIALLERFGTIDKIMSASVEELSQVNGISKKIAENIKKYFEENL